MDSAKLLSVSLNPTYLCNFRCSFCYLTPEQLADQKKLDPAILVSLLEDIKSHGYIVDHVDLYGGEVALLSPTYLENIDKILNTYSEPTINVITNLSRINSYFLHDYIDLSVSFDFEAREKHEQVLTNIAKTPKKIAILMLASPELMKLDVDKMIRTFNSLSNVISVEIKPYSSNQANVLNTNYLDFEDFIKKWLLSPVVKNFTFVNADRIFSSLNGTYSAYSDAHVYITPSGKFGVLEFDNNDNEFFLEFDTFKEYLNWSNKEKVTVNNNPICSKCPYVGRCLTEHYRDVKSIEYSCNGFRYLLDWSQANQYLINN